VPFSLWRGATSNGCTPADAHPTRSCWRF